MHFTAIPAAAILVLSNMALAAPQPKQPKSDLSLTAQLRLVDTAADRYQILSDDKDFVYDLGQNGGLTIANGQTFPALVGSGTSVTVAKFDACGIAKVHIHPRAAEMQVLLSGRLITEMVPELGVVDAKGNPRVIRTELKPNMMTIFGQGAFHTQINPDCEPATAVTIFNSEDPGFGFIADETFALDDDNIAAQFGNSIAGADIDRIRHAIPKGVATQVDACLKKCKIPKRSVSSL